jgi:hypothetical protein
MRQEGQEYIHSITMILTANRNPLSLDIDDRRFAFIQTPNRLDQQDWVAEEGGIVSLIERIEAETLDFCYYLATSVENLPPDEYVIAPQGGDKRKIILEGLPPYQRITQMIAQGQIEDLKELAYEHDILNFTDGWAYNRLLDERVQDLYYCLTDGKGNKRAILNALRQANIRRLHTTSNGQNIFYYQVEGLSDYLDEKESEDE